jgi:hypothetical protein
MTTQTGLSLPGREAPPRLDSYDAERARFHLQAPERYNPVLHIIEGWAAEQPGARTTCAPVTGTGR